jgi:Sec-independent protein translocase protein TatA
VLDSKFLIVILVLGLIVFGAKRIRSIGSDLGAPSGVSAEQSMRAKGPTRNCLSGIPMTNE